MNPNAVQHETAQNLNLMHRDFLVKLSGDPAVFDRTIQQLGKAVLHKPADHYVQDAESLYVMRIYGSPDYILFAIKKQGYGEVIKEIEQDKQITVDEVKALLRTSKTPVDWRNNCTRVKQNFGGGYPGWWYAEIIKTGFINEVLGPDSDKISIKTE